MMKQRPDLELSISSEIFRSYYYLKEELIAFCRREGLQTSGGKEELTERIAKYLDTGEKSVSVHAVHKNCSDGEITLDTLIEPSFVCSEKHRMFFRKMLGNRFTFRVDFQKWLKSNTGKTYRDAVEAYRQIVAERRKGGGSIGKQFEYNTYIRDFFNENPGRTLDEAIRCWKHKKSLPGAHRYESADLKCLSESGLPGL